MHANRAVRVTGMGVATSLGYGIPSFSNALRKGICGITRNQGASPELGGFLLNFEFEACLKDLQLPSELHSKALRVARRAPRSVQCSVLVCLEAWQSAGLLDSASFNPERCSVIVCGQNISSAYQFAMFEKFGDEPNYLPPSYGLQFLDTDHVAAVSEVLGLRGEGSTAGGASASGNVGLIQGLRLIRHGMADLCVVTGAMADLSPVECSALRQLGAMGGTQYRDEPKKACRPFDADRGGFIYGQGAACLVLESESHARSRQAPDRGAFLGGAICLDASRTTDLNAAGAARAMCSAMDDAGIGVGQIDYINAHATSSVQGDEKEIQAIKSVLNDRTPEVWINGTKELTGHCLWAAGVVEAAAALIQGKEGFLHPNPNLEKPIDSQCRFVGTSPKEARCRIALSNSFGFGGINTSIVLQSA